MFDPRKYGFQRTAGGWISPSRPRWVWTFGTTRAGDTGALDLIPVKGSEMTTARGTTIITDTATIEAMEAQFSMKSRVAAALNRVRGLNNNMIGRVWNRTGRIRGVIGAKIAQAIDMTRPLARRIARFVHSLGRPGQLAALTWVATSIGGQQALVRTAQTVTRPVNWVATKALFGVSWVLDHLGAPGRAVDSWIGHGLAKAYGFANRTKAALAARLHPNSDAMRCAAGVSGTVFTYSLGMALRPVTGVWKLLARTAAAVNIARVLIAESELVRTRWESLKTQATSAWKRSSDEMAADTAVFTVSSPTRKERTMTAPLTAAVVAAELDRDLHELEKATGLSRLEVLNTVTQHMEQFPTTPKGGPALRNGEAGPIPAVGVRTGKHANGRNNGRPQAPKVATA